MEGRGIRDEYMKEITCPWQTLCMYVYSAEVGKLNVMIGLYKTTP
jgi:hypothetical protein